MTEHDKCEHDVGVQANGPAIKAIRERTGLSLTELSRATEIDLTTLSRIEKGNRPGTEAQLVAVAKALKVPTTAVINAPAVA